MLTSLEVKDLAIIESLKIDFTSGFNVITGETGAGKSILIRALSLLFGAKASSESIRRGAKQAVISGRFVIPWRHKTITVLERYGISAEGDEKESQLLVRRNISAKGRSQAWINDTAVTIGTLRELSDSLVDVFGQHEGGKLLDSACHMTYLDQFLPKPEVQSKVAEQFAECSSMLNALIAKAEEFSSKQRDADYLSFRCDELLKFAPSLEDYEENLKMCERAKGMLSLQEASVKARTLVDEGASGEPISTPVWEVSRLLERLASDDKFASLCLETTRIANELDELSYSINNAFSAVEFDEHALERAQQRVSGYQELLRKLNVKDVEELILEQKRLSREYSFLQSAAKEALTELGELEKSCLTLQKSCKSLTKGREQARRKFKTRVEKQLKELAMPGARVDVEFSSVTRNLTTEAVAIFGDDFLARWKRLTELLGSCSSMGAERVQFVLAANQGEVLQPLHKVASGGEMSRITLAIKKALVAGADTCILVFDEIDAGISGRVADIVGQKMKEISKSFQVICISHLAQVAAYSETHFVVSKKNERKRTVSQIVKMSDRKSAEEIAKLLSGHAVTPTSLANAKNLIKRAGDH